MAVSMARLQKRSEMNVMAFTVKCYGLFSGWDIGEEIGFKEICVSFLINPSFFFVNQHSVIKMKPQSSIHFNSQKSFQPIS